MGSAAVFLEKYGAPASALRDILRSRTAYVRNRCGLYFKAIRALAAHGQSPATHPPPPTPPPTPRVPGGVGGSGGAGGGGGDEGEGGGHEGGGGGICPPFSSRPNWQKILPVAPIHKFQMLKAKFPRISLWPYKNGHCSVIFGTN